eukprot:6753541-Lingulodinium_polyedra.AAC.1
MRLKVVTTRCHRSTRASNRSWTGSARYWTSSRCPGCRRTKPSGDEDGSHCRAGRAWRFDDYTATSDT